MDPPSTPPPPGLHSRRRRRNCFLPRNAAQFKQRPPLLNFNDPAAVTHQQKFDFGPFADSTPTITYGRDGGTPSSEPSKRNSPGVSPAALSEDPVGNVDSGGGGGTPSSEPPKRNSPGVSPAALSEDPVGIVDSGGGGRPPAPPLGLQGYEFTPHLITVNTGEDIASTILAFSLQQQPRRVCILSANGSIASVALRRQPPPEGIDVYEGRFEIISLAGSFPKSDDNSGTGVLTLTMFGVDNIIHGGEVAGILRAASPVQIVLNSFICEEDKKPKGGALTSPTPSPSPLPAVDTSRP